MHIQRSRLFAFSREHLCFEAAAAGQQGRHWLAASLYNLLGTLEPTEVDAWVRAGEHYEREGRFDEAARVAWFAAGRLSPTDPERAMELARRALTLDPHAVERPSCRQQARSMGAALAPLVWTRAEQALDQRRFGEARVLLRLAAELEPDAFLGRQRFQGLELEIARRQKELEERLAAAGDDKVRSEAAEQLLELAPEDDAIRCSVASLFIEQGHYERARRLVEQVLARHPDSPQALYLWAQLAAHDLECASAIRTLRRAAWLIREDRERVDGWLRAASSWLPHDREFERALRALRKELGAQVVAATPPPPPVARRYRSARNTPASLSR